MDDTPNPAMGSTTLIEVLNELRGDGYTQQLVAGDDATVRCTGCEQQATPADLHIDGYRRLEGASDAADMNLVLWASCPNCGERATLTLGYGPNASEADEAVVLELDLDPSSGTTPDEAA